MRLLLSFVGAVIMLRASILIVGALCVLIGPHVPGADMVAIVAVEIAASHTITLRRFTRNLAAQARPR